MTPKKRPLTKLPKLSTAGSRYAKKLAAHLRRKTRARRIATLPVVLLLVLSTSALGQSVNDVMQWSLVNGRYTGKYKPLLTTYITEGTNLWYTDVRVRAALSAVSPLSFNSSTGEFSLTGLSGLGTANQLPGMNAAGNGLEWKTFSGSSHIAITHGTGTLAWSLIAGSVDSTRLATGSVPSTKIKDSTIVGPDIANGQVVRELNGFKDEVVIAGEGGATVRTASGPTKDSVIINSGAGGEGGTITAIQNIDGRLAVTNPNGPTTTIDMVAEKADSVVIKDGNVRSEEIKDGTIQRADLTAGMKGYDSDAADLADSSIAAHHSKIADSAVTVKDDAVTSAKILNGTILPADMDTSVNGMATQHDIPVPMTSYLMAEFDTLRVAVAATKAVGGWAGSTAPPAPLQFIIYPTYIVIDPHFNLTTDSQRVDWMYWRR